MSKFDGARVEWILFGTSTVSLMMFQFTPLTSIIAHSESDILFINFFPSFDLFSVGCIKLLLDNGGIDVVTTNEFHEDFQVLYTIASGLTNGFSHFCQYIFNFRVVQRIQNDLGL